MMAWGLLAAALFSICCGELVFYANFDSPGGLDIATEQCGKNYDPLLQADTFAVRWNTSDPGLFGNALTCTTSVDGGNNPGLSLRADVDDYTVEGPQLTVSFWADLSDFPTLPATDVVTNIRMLAVSSCESTGTGILDADTWPWFMIFKNGDGPNTINWELHYQVVTKEGNSTGLRTVAIPAHYNPAGCTGNCWFQVVMVYTGTQVRLYFGNTTETLGSPVQSFTHSGSLITPPGFSTSIGKCLTDTDTVQIDGGSINVVQMYGNMKLDEVRVYDTALDAQQLEDLHVLSAPATAPFIDDFTIMQPYETTVLASDTLNGVVVPEPSSLDADNIISLWSDSSVCAARGVARIQNPEDSFALDVLWDASSDSDPVTLRFSVVNGSEPDWNQVCSFKEVSFLVGDDAPIVVDDIAIFIDGEQTADIYSNEVVELRVVADGFPKVRYQWGEYRDVTSLDSNSTPFNTSAFVAIPNGQNSSYFFDAATYDPAVGLATGLNTPGDVAPLVRLELFNRAGLATSSNLTLTIRSGSRPGGGGDGDDDVVVPAVAGSIGAVALLCCCLLLLLLCCVIIVAVVIVVAVAGGGVSAVGKAKRGHQIKLPSPDFNNLAFGTAIDSKHGHLSAKQKSALDSFGELFDNDRFVLATICADNAKATEAEKVAKATIFLYHERGFGNDALDHFVSIEVQRSDKEGTLFRANSISSKMFNAFAKMVGLQYVFSIFARPVNELAHEAALADGVEAHGYDGGSSLLEPMSFEVDPTRLEDAADATVNTLALRLTAQKLFDALRKSCGKVPVEFRRTINHVNGEVVEKFGPSPAYKAMGGFLFLRFLCPSLMAPQVYGLLEAPPSSTCQRQLILIAKIMQNLANDTLPGKKEDFMRELNAFISDNKSALEGFYRTLIDTSSSGPSNNIRVPATVKYNALADLHSYISQNHSKIIGAVAEVDDDLAARVEDALEAVGPI